MDINWLSHSAKFDPSQHFLIFTILTVWIQQSLLLFLNANTIYGVRVTRRSKKLLDFLSNFNFTTSNIKSGQNMGS